MTARWPAYETSAQFYERKQQWRVTAWTELPTCGHVVSTHREHADKRTAARDAATALKNKVTRHPNHAKKRK